MDKRSSSRQSHHLNPPEVLLWNSDKSVYLQELAANGFSIVETQWVEKGEKPNLANMVEDHGWSDIVVVKPTVGEGAANIHFVKDVAEFQANFEELSAKHALMVQPIRREVKKSGELSIVFFGGKFSHAFWKITNPTDAEELRVQRMFGGLVEPVELPHSVINAAKAALDAAPGETLYARVDVILDDPSAYGGSTAREPRKIKKHPVVRFMEIEALDPNLGWKSTNDPEGAAQAFADALLERVKIEGIYSSVA